MGYEQTEVMTEISARQWDFITGENLTVKEAVEFLKNGMQVRTFRDNIRDVYWNGKGNYPVPLNVVDGVCAEENSESILSEKHLESILTEKLCIYSQFYGEKQIQPDSIRRKVRNWMNGRNSPTDREEVFQICFALDLNLNQAERFLNRLVQQGIHYRNTRELIYAYCLKYHLGYEHALQMCERLIKKKGDRKDCNQTDKGESRMSSFRELTTQEREPIDPAREPMTQALKKDFQKMTVEEDIFTFILNNKQSMGSSHNTAYAYFKKMLSLLSGEEMDGEERYSMEDIADAYLRMNVPLDKKTAGYTHVQKIVKKYWPGARGIKSMKSRSEEVNRKTLLLLYLVTGGMAEEEYHEIDETYSDSSAYLEFHCKKMNQMLRECGMSRIDPRNIFDYLILYCLRPEEELFMSERMELLMEEIFEENQR